MATREIKLASYTSRIDLLMKHVSNKKTLHLGCSSGRYIKARLERGSLLHQRLEDVSSDLHGIDLDGESLVTMRELGYDNLYEGNVEHLDQVGLSEKFDVVLAGDLLEHITCPGAMLNGIKPLLADSGRAIISTNNAFGLNYQLRRWTGSFKEHFEHVCFFSPETLLHLFERHGYRVVEMHGAYTEPPYTLTQKLKFMIGAPLYKIFPILAGTLVVIAEKAPISISKSNTDQSPS